MSKAYPLAVEIIATEASIDGLVDDIITIMVDDEHWIDRAKSVWMTNRASLNLPHRSLLPP